MRKIRTYIIAALVLCSCTRDRFRDALAPDGVKSPLETGLIIEGGAPAGATKAVDMTFDNNDNFVVYLRHVIWNGTTAGSRSNVEADNAPQLITFTKGTGAMTSYDKSDITPIGTNTALGLSSSNTMMTNDITPDHNLYWDDFSDSASPATDLRTENHYLESYYGYCYNGGTPSTDLIESTGVLGWAVATDQRTGFKTSDILWSAEQTPVRYEHTPAGRPGLTFPFTHAMSKVTIVVVYGEGFSNSDGKLFDNVAVTLKGVNRVSTLTAPSMSVSAFGTSADIMMQKHGVNVEQCSYSALIAPTLLKAGKTLATITGLDGNSYNLVLSNALIDAKVYGTTTTKDNAWSKQLAAYDATAITPGMPAAYSSAQGGITRPGIHYLVTVTVNKQEITASASVRNWENVDANGVGEIQFDGDIKEKGDIAEELKTNGFAIYQSDTGTDYERTTIWEYTLGQWVASPKIFWPNAVDSFYFRALSNYNTADGKTFDMDNGRDVLWGRTPEDGPIAPRTGDVELNFEHAMAKITINLVDGNASTPLPGGVAADDYDNPLNPRLNLSRATIQITSLLSSGSIDIHTGDITPDGVAADLLDSDYYAANDANIYTPQVEDYVVVPQDITDESEIIVTLADGTIYKLSTNTCMDERDAKIDQWARGKHYTYTIIVTKEEITFRALIKDWIETSGSGNANLEWD